MRLSFAEGAALVAGGSGGIGAAVCSAFGAAGVPVVLTYRGNVEAAEAVVAAVREGGGRCTATRCDLTDAPAVAEVVAAARAEHGRLGQVVYAAGPSFAFHPVGAIPDQDWHRVLATDVNGAFHLVQSAVRAFREQDGGNIVAVTTAAVGRVAPNDVLSAAPKCAIEALIRNTARESARHGIRANSVGPGWVDAGLGRRALDEQLDPARRERIRTGVIPLGRFGTPEDVAAAVAFLCSREAGFVTGQSLAVDGGAQL